MAVNASDILRQHTVQTNDAGRFAIDLPSGHYDLLFFDEIHEPFVLAGVAIEEDLVREIVRPLADSSASLIHGVVTLADGAAASGYTIELHDGSASTKLASVVGGYDGSFEITDLARGETDAVMHIGIERRNRECVLSECDRFAAPPDFAREGENEIVCAHTFR